MSMKESQYAGRILFTEWKPQAYFDFHHMGSYGARIFYPPYAEPIRPLADPLVWRESEWYGAEMANKSEEAGLSGVMNDGQYSGWGHFGFHWITPFHNIAGHADRIGERQARDAPLHRPEPTHRRRAQSRSGRARNR